MLWILKYGTRASVGRAGALYSSAHTSAHSLLTICNTPPPDYAHQGRRPSCCLRATMGSRTAPRPTLTVAVSVRQRLRKSAEI